MAHVDTDELAEMIRSAVEKCLADHLSRMRMMVATEIKKAVREAVRAEMRGKA